MLTYHDILAAVSMRINALDGTDPADLQITYSSRPLIDEVFQSSIFPMNAIRDAIIACEGKIAEAVALSSNRSLRAYLRALSAALASGDPLPTIAGGKPVIGNFGAVIDVTTMLTPQPVAAVRNRLLSPNNYLVSAYQFAIDGATIIHTRTSVTMECCVYSAEDQTAAFDANDPILFPDALAEVYENGSMALLIRDDEFVEQATRYGAYFAAFLATLPPTPMEAVAA